MFCFWSISTNQLSSTRELNLESIGLEALIAAWHRLSQIETETLGNRLIQNSNFLLKVFKGQRELCLTLAKGLVLLYWWLVVLTAFQRITRLTTGSDLWFNTYSSEQGYKATSVTVCLNASKVATIVTGLPNNVDRDIPWL